MNLQVERKLRKFGGALMSECLQESITRAVIKAVRDRNCPSDIMELFNRSVAQLENPKTKHWFGEFVPLEAGLKCSRTRFKTQ